MPLKAATGAEVIGLHNSTDGALGDLWQCITDKANQLLAPYGLAPANPNQGLEALEEQIDECLTMARNLDREELESVIHLLRRARNEIVWKLEH